MLDINKQAMKYSLQGQTITIYERDDEGAEVLYVETKEWATYNKNNELVVHSRTVRTKHPDDDLPKISKAYSEYKENAK